MYQNIVQMSNYLSSSNTLKQYFRCCTHVNKQDRRKHTLYEYAQQLVGLNELHHFFHIFFVFVITSATSRRFSANNAVVSKLKIYLDNANRIQVNSTCWSCPFCVTW